MKTFEQDQFEAILLRQGNHGRLMNQVFWAIIYSVFQLEPISMAKDGIRFLLLKSNLVYRVTEFQARRWSEFFNKPAAIGYLYWCRVCLLERGWQGKSTYSSKVDSSRRQGLRNGAKCLTNLFFAFKSIVKGELDWCYVKGPALQCFFQIRLQDDDGASGGLVNWHFRHTHSTYAKTINCFELSGKWNRSCCSISFLGMCDGYRCNIKAVQWRNTSLLPR